MMTNEERNDREDYALAGDVSVEEARVHLDRFIQSHYCRDERAIFSIPANPKRDSDIRLGAFITRAERELAELKRLRIACDALIDAWDDDEIGQVDVALIAPLRRGAR